MYYTDDPVRDYDNYIEDLERQEEKKEWEEELWRRADIQYEEQRLNEDD